VVARGTDSELRVFSNVCRHRAGPVASGAGRRSSLQCGYHGWTYTLAGQILRTPEFDGVECFEKEKYCLPQFRVAEWQGLIFVNLDPQALTLQEMLGDLPQRIAHRDLTAMQFTVRKEWYLDCNWKVYVDNYLEGYHIPLVHPALNRELDYQRYQVETMRYYSIQHSPIKAEARRLTAGAGSDEAQYFWVFPNLMLNVYPDNFSTNLIVPISATRTLTIFEWYFMSPKRAEIAAEIERVVEFSDEVQLEDIAICESVQRGLASRFYCNGRYSVKRENGLHHFHGLMADFLNT
jgi:choline monooxygenase